MQLRGDRPRPHHDLARPRPRLREGVSRGQRDGRLHHVEGRRTLRLRLQRQVGQGGAHVRQEPAHLPD